MREVIELDRELLPGTTYKRIKGGGTFDAQF